MSNASIRVLVVDDEEMILLNLAVFLEDDGFTVFSASSGEAALELLSRETVDVAIVDIRLPGMDGNTLILEAHKLYPETR